MTGVAVELGPLAVVQRVLDGQRMQAELLAQHGEVVAVGRVQVQPDGDGLMATGHRARCCPHSPNR